MMADADFDDATVKHMQSSAIGPQDRLEQAPK
jgi:hypothetical protein